MPASLSPAAQTRILGPRHDVIFSDFFRAGSNILQTAFSVFGVLFAAWGSNEPQTS